MYTETQVANIVAEAKTAAADATNTFINDVLKGEDAFACGFAWVNIYEFNGKKIRKNSKIGKALESVGVNKSDWEKTFRIWNPSGTFFQNIDCKEAGARAAADVFKKYGFTAFAGSRLD